MGDGDGRRRRRHGEVLNPNHRLKIIYYRKVEGNGAKGCTTCKHCHQAERACVTSDACGTLRRRVSERFHSLCTTFVAFFFFFSRTSHF